MKEFISFLLALAIVRLCGFAKAIFLEMIGIVIASLAFYVVLPHQRVFFWILVAEAAYFVAYPLYGRIEAMLNKKYQRWAAGARLI